MIELTIQEGSPVEVSATETIEAVTVGVTDTAPVTMEIIDNDQTTTLVVNGDGELIDLSITETVQSVAINVDEPTEVVVVMDETQKIIAPEKLDDFTRTVDTADGPVSGESEWALPAEWEDARIRVFRNGSKFFAWNRTVTGIALTQSGDVWIGGGFPETVSIENY